MPEQVNIASFSIDFDDVIKESAKLKKQLDSLKESQKDLRASGEESSEAFVANEVQIKKLSKAYRDNQQFATALDEANEDLNKTMAVQGKSTQELRDSRRQLNQISKNIAGDTEEEVQLREKLNKAIDDQTEALRDQGSQFNRNKDRVGEYKDSILEAAAELRRQQSVLIETREELIANQKAVEEGTEEYEDYSNALVVVNGDLDKVNDSLGENSKEVNAADFSIQGFIGSSKDAGGASKFFSENAKGAVKGLGNMTKAAIKFIATPIGFIIALIAGAFLLVKNAMNRSEESTNKIKKAFSAFTGILKAVLKILAPLGDFLIDGLVKGFELVEKAISKAMQFIQRALDRLGFEEAAEKLGDFTEKIEEAAAASKILTQAEFDLQKAQRKSRLIQLQFQKDAEKLRQIRDDENRSIQERIRANEKLGAVLRKQSAEELAIARQALAVAELRIDLEGETTATLDERAAALTEIADIEERITGQESEQLTNRVALEKEKAAAIKAIKDQEEADALEAAKIKQEAAQEAAEAAVDLAQWELNQYIRANESKLESDKFLTDESVKEEKRRLDLLAAQRRDFAKTELQKGTISQLEYNERIAQINQANREEQEELERSRREAESMRKAIDVQNRLTLLAETTRVEHEILTQALELDRIAEVEAAEGTGADIALINEIFAERQKQLDNAATHDKIQGFASVLGQFSDFTKDQLKTQVNALEKEKQAELENFEGTKEEKDIIEKKFAERKKKILAEESKAGKAAAVAAGLIATYQSAINAYNSLAGIPIVGVGLGIAAATLATITGLKNVSKIKNTPTTFAKGDILKGRSHTRGGIPFSIGGRLGFEAEGGEALINKRSTSMFAPLLSAINVAGGGKKFQNGSILGGSSVPASPLIDYDALALKVAEAYSALPAPVVSVEEINTVNTNVEVVESLATS